MIKIYNKTTNELLGRINETDLDFLIDNLEEESITDQDYFIRKETVDSFVELGGSEQLISLLRGGMRSIDSMEIRWVDETKEK